MTTHPNPDEVWADASIREAELLAHAKSLIAKAVEETLVAVEPAMRSLRREAARRFLVAVTVEASRVTERHVARLKVTDVEAALWAELLSLRQTLQRLRRELEDYERVH